MALSRRHFVRLGSGWLSLLFVPMPQARAQVMSPAEQSERRRELEAIHSTFAFGVASGDPLQDRVILWTQVSSADRSVPVFWEVALDASFTETVAEGWVEAREENDHTVKVDAILPFPGTSYYYRFKALDCWSMVGRTRTASRDAQNIRLAIVSCSSIWSGYMNAYEQISRRNDLDLVVHCGDYIYDVFDKNEKRNMPAASADSEELTDLASHRRRFRYYRRDPFLRRAHQQHPWAIVWDNHDIWTSASREDAIRAFHEWTPVRSPRPEDPSYIYRSLDYGPLLRISLLDTRHIARDAGAVVPGTSSPSLLGDEQFAWLQDEVAAPKQWHLIVNQILMAPMNILGIPLISSSWSHFAEDRKRTLASFAAQADSTSLVVTGDLHVSFVADLESDGQAAGVEFLPTSVTRGNLDESLGGFLAKWGSKAVIPLIKKENPQIRYFEATRHGYGIVDLRPTGATLELWHVPHEEQSLDQTLAFSGFVAKGSRKISSILAQPAPDGERSALPAPPEPRLYAKGIEWGGLRGEYFDFEEQLRLKSRLVELRLYGKSQIRGMVWIYEDGMQLSVGTLKESMTSLRIDEGESIVSMVLSSTKDLGGVLIQAIGVQTSRGRSLSSGVLSEDAVRFVAPEGYHIAGCYGRQLPGIYKLGPVFASNFS